VTAIQESRSFFGHFCQKIEKFAGLGVDVIQPRPPGFFRGFRWIPVYLLPLVLYLMPVLVFLISSSGLGINSLLLVVKVLLIDSALLPLYADYLTNFILTQLLIIIFIYLSVFVYAFNGG